MKEIEVAEFPMLIKREEGEKLESTPIVQVQDIYRGGMYPVKFLRGNRNQLKSAWRNRIKNGETFLILDEQKICLRWKNKLYWMKYKEIEG